MKKIRIVLACFMLTVPVVRANDTLQSHSLEMINVATEQHMNPRITRPFGFAITPVFFNTGLNYGGIGSSVDYMINHALEFEVNLATNTYEVDFLSLGLNWHFNTLQSTSRATPFTGLAVGKFTEYLTLNIPVGICYIAKNGLSMGLVAHKFIVFSGSDRNTPDIIYQLKLGWHFSIK